MCYTMVSSTIKNEKLAGAGEYSAIPANVVDHRGPTLLEVAWSNTRLK